PELSLRRKPQAIPDPSTIVTPLRTTRLTEQRAPAVCEQRTQTIGEPAVSTADRSTIHPELPGQVMSEGPSRVTWESPHRVTWEPPRPATCSPIRTASEVARHLGIQGVARVSPARFTNPWADRPHLVTIEIRAGNSRGTSYAPDGARTTTVRLMPSR